MTISGKIRKFEEKYCEALLSQLEADIATLSKNERGEIFVFALVIDYSGRGGVDDSSVRCGYNTFSNLALQEEERQSDEHLWNLDSFLQPEFLFDTFCENHKALASFYASQHDVRISDKDINEQEEIDRLWEICTVAIAKWKHTSSFKQLLPSCKNIILTNGVGQGAVATERVNGPMPDKFLIGGGFYPGE